MRRALLAVVHHASNERSLMSRLLALKFHALLTTQKSSSNLARSRSASWLISVWCTVAFVVREFLSVAAFVISLARSLSMTTGPARLSSYPCFLLPHIAQRNPKPNRMLEVMQPRYRD